MQLFGARRAFTLIELLIVVAIIAILAAIAVPNFLEAQTRSKVARVKNDQRVIANGQQQYFLEWNQYTRDQDNSLPDIPPGSVGENGYTQLTTPVAYLTSYLTDPFSPQQRNFAGSNIAPAYVIGSGSDNSAPNCDSDRRNPNAPAQSFVVISIGPDVEDSSSGNDCFPRTVGGQDRVRLGIYDPTNGTVSNGDILRFGGNFKQGFYELGGHVGSGAAEGFRPQFEWSFGQVLPE